MTKSNKLDPIPPSSSTHPLLPTTSSPPPILQQPLAPPNNNPHQTQTLGPKRQRKPNVRLGDIGGHHLLDHPSSRRPKITSKKPIKVSKGKKQKPRVMDSREFIPAVVDPTILVKASSDRRVNLNGVLDEGLMKTVHEWGEKLTDPGFEDKNDGGDVEESLPLVVAMPDLGRVSARGVAHNPITGRAPASTSNVAPNGVSNPIKKTYAGIFKSSRIEAKGMKLSYFEQGQNEEDDVELDASDDVPFVETWGYCLIGCFTGPFPGRIALDVIVRSWGVECKIIPYGKGWTIFKFMNDEDRIKVLHGGPYMTYGKTLMLKIVDEGVMFTDDLFMNIPVWCVFRDLPLSVWSESGLSKISSKVGKPMYTDQFTKERTKMNFARCLVEIDVSKKPIMEFGVKMSGGRRYVQKVEYENYPEFCYQCKCFGHNHFTCSKLNKVDEPIVPPNVKDPKVVPPKHVVPVAHGAHKVPVAQGDSVRASKKIGKRTELKSNPLFVTNPFGVLSSDVDTMVDGNGKAHERFSETSKDVMESRGSTTLVAETELEEGEWQSAMLKHGKEKSRFLYAQMRGGASSSFVFT